MMSAALAPAGGPGLAALLVVPLAASVRSDSTVTAAVVGVLAILLLSAWGGRSWLDRRRRREVDSSGATTADRGTAALLVDVADDEEHRAEDRDHVGDQAARQQLGEHLRRC